MNAPTTTRVSRLLVLLEQYGPMPFGDLRELLPDVKDTVLSAMLSKLKARGDVDRCEKGWFVAEGGEEREPPADDDGEALPPPDERYRVGDAHPAKTASTEPRQAAPKARRRAAGARWRRTSGEDRGQGARVDDQADAERTDAESRRGARAALSRNVRTEAAGVRVPRGDKILAGLDYRRRGRRHRGDPRSGRGARRPGAEDEAVTALAIRLEDREAEAELAALRVRDGLLGDELAALTAKIHQHFAFIGLHFDAECKTLAALQAELAELNAPPAQRAEPPPDEREAKPAANRHDRRVVSADAKRLFRQIAQRCHPDRTDDELLHGIFLQAKDAYARGDVAALEELRLVLGSNAAPRTAVERRFLRLQVERDKLVADVAAKERALAALRMSQEAGQVHIWEQRVALIGQEGALAEIRQALFAQLQNLRGNLAYLRAMRRQQAMMQQQAAFNHYASQSTTSTGGGLWNTLFGFGG